MNCETPSASFLRKSAKAFLAAALWIALYGVAWAGQSVSLGWKASPDPKVVGYAVYYGTSSGAYSWRIDAGASTNCTVPDLTEGVYYYFVAVPYDVDIVENSPSHEESFMVAASAVNMAPLLAPIGDHTVRESTLLSFTVTATDGDLPSQVLSYSLDAGAPAGASIDPTTGVFSWTPTALQAPSTNLVTVRVVDNGTPALTDFETIRILVMKSKPPQAISTVANSGLSTNLKISPHSRNSFVITGGGVPGHAYRIEYTDKPNCISGANWQTLGSAVADDSGVFSFVDTAAPLQRFYRSVYSLKSNSM